MHTAHISALEAKHASLERKITDEQARPSPNGTVITDLKRRKLRVKEEITHL